MLPCIIIMEKLLSATQIEILRQVYIGLSRFEHNNKTICVLLIFRNKNRNKQAGAGLCQAQAQAIEFTIFFCKVFLIRAD